MPDEVGSLPSPCPLRPIANPPTAPLNTLAHHTAALKLYIPPSQPIQICFMAAPVTTTWTPRTVTLGIRLTAVLTPILVTATPPTSTNPARQLTSRVTGRRLTLLADRGSSRAPAFFVAVPPTHKRRSPLRSSFSLPFSFRERRMPETRSPTPLHYYYYCKILHTHSGCGYP